MDISRCFAVAVCFLTFGYTSPAALFISDIATDTYSLNGHGVVRFQEGNQRQIIDLGAQNAGVEAKTLTLVYDTDTDALEVVRKADGSVVYTYMSFISGVDIQGTGLAHGYRQAFITLSGSNEATLSGTNVTLSGTDTMASGTNTYVSGSIEGPFTVGYRHSNIIDFHWDATFQLSIPGDVNTLSRVIRGHLITKKQLLVRQG